MIDEKLIPLQTHLDQHTKKIIMPVTTLSRYITTNLELLDGEPIIIGTKTPIRAIIELWRLGISPEEILIHLPR